MKLHRNIIWLIPLLLFATFPLWSVPVGKFLAPRGGFDKQVATEVGKKHDFTLDSVKITQHKNSKVSAVIIAQRARTGEDKDLLLMDEVDADLLDDGGNVTKIVARRGSYNTTTELLTLIDDVVVHKISDNQFLYTDLLLYDNEKRTVNCPGATRLEAEGAVINGGRFHYDIDSETYVIDKRVHCLLNRFETP
ncbi:LPS export ABC transporter periplasmic protein LptC [Desulforhopalus singaporensis]|uniref:LPS export ABC transporter protein LptC n=1 Tax=Desulforhopalus singaporensis TaxID=91360 RepID=A0A1H0KSQ0_9BACT|nr:LPS export ABC transporter periplasmic protein LptC [Desulforhopalus singaporensis]SDO58801.1 LPS export ABC transporter protein LptC [Desulforhopalus singaporensis]